MKTPGTFGNVRQTLLYPVVSFVLFSDCRSGVHVIYLLNSFILWFVYKLRDIIQTSKCVASVQSHLDLCLNIAVFSSFLSSVIHHLSYPTIDWLHIWQLVLSIIGSEA